jgi:hypothetical protein
MSYLISDMLEIASEKYLLVCELLVLTKEQTLLIGKDDVEGLERHIGYKQNIICRISLLDDRFGELRAQLQEEYKVQTLESLKDNSSIKKLLDLDLQTKDILQTMLEIDEINLNKGKNLLKKIGEKIRNTSKAQIAFKEYQIRKECM